MQLAVAEEMVETQGPDAMRVPFAQIRRRDIGIRDRDAAQAIWSLPERVEHRGIVVSMRAALHQYAAREACLSQLREISFERRVRLRVASILGVGKKVRRTEYMGMRVTGIRRRRHFRARDVAWRQAGRR